MDQQDRRDLQDRRVQPDQQVQTVHPPDSEHPPLRQDLLVLPHPVLILLKYSHSLSLRGQQVLPDQQAVQDLLDPPVLLDLLGQTEATVLMEAQVLPDL